MKDSAEMVKSINMRQNQYNGTSYQTYGQPYVQSYNDQNSQDQYQQYQHDDNNSNQIEITIYADDATAELKINQEQLSTLMNIGYVDNIEDKYTFKKSMISQIKSLIDPNNQDPDL